jgi:hypothetical protein
MSLLAMEGSPQSTGSSKKRPSPELPVDEREAVGPSGRKGKLTRVPRMTKKVPLGNGSS